MVQNKLVCHTMKSLPKITLAAALLMGGCVPSIFGATFEVLHHFTGSPQSTDGLRPYAGVIQARDGNYYGTTFGRGGSVDTGGSIYQLSAGGAYTFITGIPAGIS